MPENVVRLDELTEYDEDSRSIPDKRPTTAAGEIPDLTIVPEALAPVRTWLDEQRAIWESRLDRLDDYVMKLMKDREK